MAGNESRLVKCFLHGRISGSGRRKAALAAAYDNRERGITYGGGGLHNGSRLSANIFADFRMTDGPSKELECTADATWDGDNVYAILLTLNGGAVLHVCKKMHLIVDSSMESEALATGKAGEAIGYAREIMRAIGYPPRGPTWVGTDNAANALVASGNSVPARSRNGATSPSSSASNSARQRSGTCATRRIHRTSSPSSFTRRRWPSRFNTPPTRSTPSPSKPRTRGVNDTKSGRLNAAGSEHHHQ